MLVAGKGLGEDVRNGAAARPVVAPREGRAREESVREKGKGLRKRGEMTLSGNREGCQSEFTKPIGPVKPSSSGSNLPDRFDRKPVEFKSKFKSTCITGSDRYTDRFDRFTDPV